MALLKHSLSCPWETNMKSTVVLLFVKQWKEHSRVKKRTMEVKYCSKALAVTLYIMLI